MSNIEWTDQTWNPFVGCSKISPGCDNCYAIRMANRIKLPHYRSLVSSMDWTGKLNRAPQHIVEKPLRRAKPTVFFVNSMSDIFHENAEDDWIVEAFDIMNRSPQHVFQVLTKRPARAVKKTRELGLVWGDHIWAGVSIEADKYAVPRSRELAKLPAKVRFVSCEPLLGALPSLPIDQLNWVIAGGESGVSKSVRAPDPMWFYDLRDRCRAAGVPFFFKQWGTYNANGARQSKKANGHLLGGREIFEMPASAYDQLVKPDPRWVRIERHAAMSPSKRLASSGARYVVNGKPSDDQTEFVLGVLSDDPGTYENPNRALIAGSGE